jgi:uncharacterized glyoxalase superfamily protein PhnB
MTSIQPELWIDRAGQAVAFYAEAFGARILHMVGEGDDIVAHETQYFADPFDPAPWRAALAEQMPDDRSG